MPEYNLTQRLTLNWEKRAYKLSVLSGSHIFQKEKYVLAYDFNKKNLCNKPLRFYHYFILNLIFCQTQLKKKKTVALAPHTPSPSQLWIDSSNF